MKGEGSTSSIQGIQNSAAIAIAALSVLTLSLLAFAPVTYAAIITSDIVADTVWTASESPYVIQMPFPNDYDSEQLKVMSGATLTIEPGVVVKFDSYNGIHVLGTLRAIGTQGQPIYFTSITDDTVGGDTDAASTVPTDGQWRHLEFASGSTGDFDHVFIRYGGQYVSVAQATGIANSGGTVIIDHTEFSHNAYDGLGQYAGSTTLRNSDIHDHDVGINMEGGTLTVENTRIHHNSESSVSHYGGALTITGSEIHNNPVGVVAASDGAITINSSSIHGNNIGIENRSEYPLYDGTDDPPIHPAITIDARNNWWGSATGPAHISNPGGIGDLVSDAVLFSPFLTTDPLAPVEQSCTINCNSNVLFLPGIEASRLYIPDSSALDGSDRLWEPTSDADGRALFMTATGTSVRNDIYTKDVLDEAYGTFNIYKSFLADLKTWKNTDHIIADYSAVPYDWRLTLDEILEYGNQTPDGRIYYSGTSRATSTPYIIQELKRLSMSSRNNGKVTIIAHSNGGLVAKALLKRLQDTNDPLLEKIDVVILVAVPQTGTPVAIGALLHGYRQGIPFDLVHPLLSPQVAREFSYNDPMAYHLLPSAVYFNGEGATTQTPLVTFNNGAATQVFINHYGNTVENAVELHDFLLGAEGRPLATVEKLNEPTVLRAGLLSYGETVHQSLDIWTPPAHIIVHEIAGWGEDTMVGIIYDNDRKCVARTLLVCTQYMDTLRYKPDLVVDGDGTVVVPSALMMSTSTVNVKRWWVDFEQFNADHRPTPALPNLNHASILEISELRSFIENMITASSSSPLPRYVRDTIPPADDTARLRFFLHSPLALSVTDVMGQEISASTSTIPGARYKRFGEVQYISVPASAAPTLHLDGFATGSFTLEVQEATGDSVTATTTFLGIPNATTTTASMNFGDGTIENASPLVVDIDADGTIDITLEPKVGEMIVPDTTPPEIQITFATSTNTIAFIGTDDMGTTTISATTTYPALKKHQREARGIATTTVTVRDLAGNTTILVYTEKLPSPDKRDIIFLEEVSYNGATTTLSNTAVSYKWLTDKNGSYKLFASHIKTIATSTESHYRPKKNETIFMTKPRDLDDEDSEDDVDSRPAKQKLPGMIIPSVVTQKGRVLVTY